MTTVQEDAGKIEQALRLILEPGQVTELRAFVKKNGFEKTHSGYYNDPRTLAFHAAQLQHQAHGIYFIPNRINPALLARAQNKSRALGKRDPTTADHDIKRRLWFLLDLDPVRPSGISSSQLEKDAALAKAEQVREYLKRLGFPLPLFADSGNGAHLNYRVDLPPQDGQLLQRCLSALDARFTDDIVAIDQTVFNPSRIWKLYGTWARKGDNTEDRPHRPARLLDVPNKLEIVSVELLEALAVTHAEAKSTSPPKKLRTRLPSPPTQRSDDWLSNWMAKHLPEAKEPEPWKGKGRKWILPVCPWNADHSDSSAYVAQQPDGKIAAGCHHNGCYGKNWHSLRELLEPGWREKREKLKKKTQKKKTPQPCTPEEARLLFNPGRTTHQGNAERLMEQYGEDLHYNPAWGWIAWNGQKWVIDQGHEEQLYKQMAKTIYFEAAEENDSSRREEIWKWAKRSEDRSIMAGSLKMAESEEGVRRETTDFDQRPMLLTVANGTVNLETGELQPYRREDLLTKQISVEYDPNAECPTFLSFLDRIFESEASMVEFIQRAVGYSLTGKTSEHCVFILHGSGRNGKSTLINVLTDLLGEFARSVEPEVLTVRRNHNNTLVEMADLAGARLVTAVETEDNKRLAEAKIKQMSGNDVVKGCHKYKNPFDFRPIWKLWYATNHKPVIRGTDEGIWSRIRLIPFDVFIPAEERDLDLGEKLKNELPGILRWALDGCLAWQTKHLAPPEKVQKATAEYRNEQDILAAFLADCCVFVSESLLPVKMLYLAYVEWCNETGEKYPTTQSKFGKRLKERGVRQERITSGGNKGRMAWKGIGLLSARQVPSEVSEISEPTSQESS